MKNFPVVFSESQLKTRIEELAKAIDRDFAGVPLVAVSVLKGSFIFYADLVQELTSTAECEFLALSSGEPKILLDIERDLENKNVLIVEELVASGKTLRFVTDVLKARRPKKLRTCALIRKQKNVDVDFVGFEHPGTDFLVGFGLDRDGAHRCLPYIGELK